MALLAGPSPDHVLASPDHVLASPRSRAGPVLVQASAAAAASGPRLKVQSPRSSPSLGRSLGSRLGRPANSLYANTICMLHADWLTQNLRKTTRRVRALPPKQTYNQGLHKT